MLSVKLDRSTKSSLPPLRITLAPSFPCYNIELWRLSYRQSTQRRLAGPPEISPTSSSTTINESLAGTNSPHQCLAAAYTRAGAAMMPYCSRMASLGTGYRTTTGITSRPAWTTGTQRSSRLSANGLGCSKCGALALLLVAPAITDLLIKTASFSKTRVKYEGCRRHQPTNISTRCG